MCFTFHPPEKPSFPLQYLYHYRLPCHTCLECCIFGDEYQPENFYSLEKLEAITGIPPRYLKVVFPPNGSGKYQLLRRCQHLTSNNQCGIYHQRPYLCALYPFQIYTFRGTYYLGISNLCPYAHSIKGLHAQEYQPLMFFIQCLQRDKPLLEKKDLIFDFQPYRFHLLQQIW